MALVPSSYLNSVVSIGTLKEDKFQSFATGYLVGFLTKSKAADGKNIYLVYLVTNRHVFKDMSAVTLRFNLREAGHKLYTLNLLDNNKQPLWLTPANPSIDIAIIPINTPLLIKDGIHFDFIWEENILFSSNFNVTGVSQGDGVFALGFPMGLAGVDKNYAIVRGGIISRLDTEILEKNHMFLIDANIFPGNSGGPVILKLEPSYLQGTKPTNKAFLIGTVQSYLPYKEEAISVQTKQTRAIFYENSGLACVVPMDYAKDLARPFIEKFNQNLMNVPLQ